MKKTHLLIFCLFIAFASNAKNLSRKVDDFDYGWSFCLENNKDVLTQGSDNWESVILPHDWSIEQNYTDKNTAGCTGYLPAGIGWYKKTFFVSKDMKKRNLRLEFDGIYRNSTIFMNGTKIYERPYGFSGFGINLDGKVNYGQDNTILVKVDRTKYMDCRWYPGSGINRDVRLVSSFPTHIPEWGVFVKTPEVSKKVAIVEVKTKIYSTKKQNLTLKSVVKTNQGEFICENKVSLKSVKGLNNAVQNIKVKAPKLWSPENPNMYAIYSYVIDKKGNVIDETVSPFGVRSIKFDSNKGFFLNGKSVKLKGVCMHEDVGCAGTAPTKEMMRYRLEELKTMGCNAIRCSHNPRTPAFMDLCDEMGFLVQSEIFDEWKVNKNKWKHFKNKNDGDKEYKWGYGDIYDDWAKKDVKDWLSRDMNHPCVIMWSIGNEIEWTYPYYWKMEKSNQMLGNEVLSNAGGDKKELANTAGQLCAWIKELDTTRPTTAGMVAPHAGTVTGYTDTVDLSGYNYRAHYYVQDHIDHPNRIMYGSESFPQYSEWKACMDNDFISGLFVWTGISYLGEASSPLPNRGGGYGAFIDLGSFRHPNYYLFKALWNKKPSIYVATQDFSKSNYLVKDGKIVENPKNPREKKWGWPDVYNRWQYSYGDSVYVEVYTNCKEVELFLNRVSLGKQYLKDNVSDNIIKWVLPYQKGELKAIGTSANGKKVEYALDSEGSAYSVKLTPSKTIMKSNGKDAVLVKAQLVDKKGVPVTIKEENITFTIEGPARNIGVNNGSPLCNQAFKSNVSITDNGRCSLLIESTKKDGDIKVSANFKGGKSAYISLRSKF